MIPAWGNPIKSTRIHFIYRLNMCKLLESLYPGKLKVLGIERDIATQENLDKVLTLMTLRESEVYWTGLAEDYCVLDSIKGMLGLEEWKKRPRIHHFLISNMTACIKDHIDIIEKINYQEES